MAPKTPKGTSKQRQLELEKDPAYQAKRDRNNAAVQKSRQKAKEKAEKTMVRVRKLKEDNKLLEGKIDEQKKTKKFLKDLFLQQTTNKMDKPTAEQLALLNEPSSEEEEESERSSSEMDDSDDDSNPGSPNYSTASSSKGKRK